jgi:hypothetical protein
VVILTCCNCGGVPAPEVRMKVVLCGGCAYLFDRAIERVDKQLEAARVVAMESLRTSAVQGRLLRDPTT